MKSSGPSERGLSQGGHLSTCHNIMPRWVSHVRRVSLHSCMSRLQLTKYTNCSRHKA
jgi:hypothetical protein